MFTINTFYTVREQQNRKMNMTKKNDETKPAKFEAPALPAGFEAVGALQAKGFFKPSEGAIVRGIMVGGRHQRTKPDASGKLGHYYQVRLNQPCTAAVDTDSEQCVVQKGEILMVDERKAMESLAEWTEREGEVEVYIAVGRRKDIGNGQTFWPMNVGAKLAEG